MLKKQRNRNKKNLYSIIYNHYNLQSESNGIKNNKQKINKILYKLILVLKK